MTRMDRWSTRRTRYMLIFAALYFSEGAPIGLIWWALPTLLRVEGVAVEHITALTAMLVLPWTLKFLWAPLVDIWRSPRWGYRAWIIAAQTCMGIALVPLIWLDPIPDLAWWSALLLVHAIAAATQDVAVDALAIRLTPTHDRGMLNGAMQGGMLLGRSLFGGGAVFAAATLSRTWVIAALVVCVWITMVVVASMGEPPENGDDARRLRGFREALMSVLRQRTTWFGIAFALTGAAAFESAGQLAGPFLVDRNVAQQTIGAFFGIAVVVAMAVGGLAGGRLSDRWGRGRSLVVFTLGFVAAIAALGAFDLTAIGGAAPAAAIILLTVMYLFIGLFTAASYALFMDLTDPRLGGTQFSTFMAATNGAEAWSGWAGGQIAGRVNYGTSFVAMCFVSLAALPLLKKLRPGR